MPVPPVLNINELFCAESDEELLLDSISSLLKCIFWSLISEGIKSYTSLIILEFELERFIIFLAPGTNNSY